MLHISMEDIPDLALRAAKLFRELVKNGVPEVIAAQSMHHFIFTGGKMFRSDDESDQPWNKK